MLPSRSLPPVECCRGTSPIHAAKSRPDLKALGSVTVDAMAVAPITPIPGTARDGSSYHWHDDGREWRDRELRSAIPQQRVDRQWPAAPVSSQMEELRDYSRP